MENARPKFSIYVRVYCCMFFALVCLIPIAIGKGAAGGGPVAPMFVVASLVWFVVTAASFWYAQVRCSSERMNFQDGLLWATASLMTGWTYLSFATVFPGLAVAFLGSVGIAVVGDLKRDKSYAPERFSKLIRFFYQNRMRR